MVKEIYDEQLAKAKQVAEMKRKKVKVADIMSALNITYAEYKKLEKVNIKPSDRNTALLESIRRSAEQYTKEELIELFIIVIGAIMDYERRMDDDE